MSVVIVTSPIAMQNSPFLHSAIIHRWIVKHWSSVIPGGKTAHMLLT